MNGSLHGSNGNLQEGHPGVVLLDLAAHPRVALLDLAALLLLQGLHITPTSHDDRLQTENLEWLNKGRSLFGKQQDTLRYQRAITVCKHHHNASKPRTNSSTASGSSSSGSTGSPRCRFGAHLISVLRCWMAVLLLHHNHPLLLHSSGSPILSLHRITLMP